MIMLKKILRNKHNYYLIILLTIFLILFIYSFKYILYVQENIDENIFNQLKNRELLVKINDENDLNFLNNNDEVEFMYYSYQNIYLTNDFIKGELYPCFINQMPELIYGNYATAIDEIILPESFYGNNINPYDFVDKRISFSIEDKTYSFLVKGIYKVENNIKFNYIYYNILNIDTLTQNIPKLRTNYYHVIIKNYKNVNEMINRISKITEVSFNDNSGKEEISLYKSVFKILLLSTTIAICFMIVLFILIIYLYIKLNKNDIILNYFLGYNNLQLALYITNYFSILIIISVLLATIFFILFGIINTLIKPTNYILKLLFNFNGLLYPLIITLSLMMIIILLIFCIVFLVLLFENKKGKLKV